jgi:hypothetical protein
MTRSPLRPRRAIPCAIVTAAALWSLAAGCARLANTPAQDLAWSRWGLCHTQVAGTEIRLVQLDGRISFWYNGPADRLAMLDCIRLAAKDGPALPEPIGDAMECSGSGAGGGM